MLFRKNNRGGENGQSMVEFAIVFPVLFLFFLAIIQTALVMTAKQVVHYAAFCGARAAMVGYDEDKVAQAAQIACIPISPKCTAGIISEFWDYGTGLVTEMPVNVFTVSEQYWEFLPEMLVIADELPGVDIIQRLRDIDLSDITNWQSMLGLGAGLMFINTMCGLDQDDGQGQNDAYFYRAIEDRGEIDNLGLDQNNWGLGEVPLRFVLSYLLTGVDINYSTSVKEGLRDVTVEVTHNYCLRVPLINKVFYYMYIHTLLRNELETRLSSLPDNLAELAERRSFDAMKELSRISDSLPLYIIPIKADCTLTVEEDFSSDNDNCDYCD